MDRLSNFRGDYDDLSFDFEEEYRMKYPCVILTGVLTEVELEMLRDKLDVYSYNLYDEDGEDIHVVTESCPLYVEFENTIKEIGTFYFSLDYILNLKYVGDYNIRLCASENKVRTIDLMNGNDLLSFIRL